MVFKRRLDCVADGFDFPNIPKAPRSCRRKISRKNTDDDDDRICAIDLLALAGKLLQECESSSASTNAFEGGTHNDPGKEIKREQVDEYKPLKSELPDWGNSNSKSTDKTTSEKCLPNKFSFCEDDGILERTSVSHYDSVHDLKPLGCENKNKDCDFSSKFGGVIGETGGVFLKTGFEEQGEAINGLGYGCLTIAGTCHSKDTPELRVPSGKEPARNGSFARHGNHTMLDSTHRPFQPRFLLRRRAVHPRIGGRRIRKLTSSKHWTAVPKLKDFAHTRADGLKALNRKRKSCYGYNAWQRDKKRRSSHRGSVVTSDGGLSSESVSNSPEKGDSVKFSIKSFRIPELFIEVPETATVGSLKRMVLEAVTALLGDGIRIGVLVQGKKVRDDSKTLSQTGISCEENTGNLGFSLEPGQVKVSTPFCSEDPLISMPSDSMNLSERSAASPMSDSAIPCSLGVADDMMNLGNGAENNLAIVLYQADPSADKSESDSRALVPVPVPVPALDIEALAVVPANPKPKHADFTQRRTRRPFSVSEVEALVQAVEELGSGRWRDVKLRAFENADHRTYVDLKDKWKTLVHTAGISPQQRRGEPVPQELLDRVLAAHAYWSEHHVKQQGKHHHQTGVRKTSENPASDRSRAQTGSM
ncbi:PREDICTED: telomere repeat-binding protein 3-like [Tarenaya hassleriana]|uniref:telomere repeat-binding protein 3-like n=1 Tax=Tarenaya hassleriana TaxID=28532 RepID=UPI0008FD0571|nr:PREDICTED: telomere repeat-binding protein 3-like [Tarenaya hassleriana]